MNYADLARDVDVDQKTAKAWLCILETSGIVYLLPPYHTNVTKRLVKTPKLYFLDTGLCAYLTQWSTPEALEAGAILETWMLAEILKSYWHHGLTPPLYFYRDKDWIHHATLQSEPMTRTVHWRQPPQRRSSRHGG